MELHITQQHVNHEPAVVLIKPCCFEMGRIGFGHMFRLVGDNNYTTAATWHYPRVQIRRYGADQPVTRHCPFCGEKIEILDVTNAAPRNRTHP